MKCSIISKVQTEMLISLTPVLLSTLADTPSISILIIWIMPLDATMSDWTIVPFILWPWIRILSRVSWKETRWWHFDKSISLFHLFHPSPRLSKRSFPLTVTPLTKCNRGPKGSRSCSSILFIPSHLSAALHAINAVQPPVPSDVQMCLVHHWVFIEGGMVWKMFASPTFPFQYTAPPCTQSSANHFIWCNIIINISSLQQRQVYFYSPFKNGKSRPESKQVDPIRRWFEGMKIKTQ